MKKTKVDKIKSDEAAQAAILAQVADSGGETHAGKVGAPEPCVPIVAEKTTNGDTPALPSEPEDTSAALQAKIEKLEASLYRAKADFQNLQRRAAIERGDAVRFANADLMKSLLPVVDDFERALAASEAADNLGAVVAGVHLVYNNLTKALRDYGLETIEALHRPFDPNVHEALLQQPTADYPPGTVVEQAAKGYRLCDRVLRPARVVVSKAPDVEPPAGDPKSAAGESEGGGDKGP